MKVNLNHPNFNIDRTRQADHQKPAGSEFKDLLHKSISQQSVEKTADKATLHPMSVGGTHLSIRNDPAIQATLDRMDGFLDVLDRYRSGLANSQMTLKDLDPLLQQIDAEKEQLSVMNKQLPEGNPLKPILEEALITATLEVVKFNRGDYV